MTVGRNDLCPCGSGKKYKKCHGGAAKVVSIQKVVDEELELVIQNFYAEYPEQRHMLELNMLLTKWVSRLKDFWPQEHVEKLAIDYFLLLKQQDTWKKYIERQLQKTVRPTVVEVLKKWTSPMMIIGEITKKESGTVTVKEVVDGKVYILDTLGETRGVTGEYVFGIVLPDARKGSNSLMVASGIVFMPNWITDALQNVKKLAKKSGLDTQAFYLENILECLDFISKSKQSDVKITPKQVEMQVVLEDMLVKEGIKSEELLSLFTAYLQAYAPNPRKAEAVAAGAFRFGKEHLFSPIFFWTNKEIAEMFGVSTSTVQKYFEEIEEFFFSVKEQFNSMPNKANMAYETGTYPRLSEYKNWELMMHMESVEVEKETDLNDYLSKFMNEAYKPKNPKEAAQLNAYEGYFANTDKLRTQHWKKAEQLNPENADVILHKAELAEDKEHTRELFAKAIKEAQKQFDDSFEIPWGYVGNRPYLRAIYAYGVWEFEHGNYEEATTQFKKLLEINPNDNQGVRYHAVSTLIILDKYNEAQKVLDRYQAPEDAIHAYLDLHLKLLKNIQAGKQLQSMTEKDAKHLIMLNPYAIPLLNEGTEPKPFPKYAAVTPGSIEEAEIIHTLLRVPGTHTIQKQF